MNFSEALIELKKGKKIKLPDQIYFLSLVEQIYFDGDIDRPARMLCTDSHIMRDDWEVVE